MSAVLPLIPVATWAYFVLPVQDPNPYAPTFAVVTALLAVLILLGFALLRSRADGEERPPPEPRRRRTDAARRGLIVMGIVAAMGILLAGAVIAIVGDAPYGRTGLGQLTLGAVAVWVLYRLLGGVANWRWTAWDDQEREQYRQTLEPGDPTFRQRPWGRRVDILAIGFSCVAAVVLAGAIGAPMIDTAGALVGGAAVVLMIAILWAMGAGQDAANSKSGVKPSEVAPLPPA
jgi:hypothetical protein